MPSLSYDLLLQSITPVDRSREAALRSRVDGKAKPVGSLGRLEDLAVQLGLIWHPAPPRTGRAAVFMFAGDHGIAAENVSPYPASVTRMMVAACLNGTAGINLLAQAAGAEVVVVDAGVNGDLPPHPELINCKIRHGSRNSVVEPALTLAEARQAITVAAEMVRRAIDDGLDIVAIGEVGISNTTAAALLAHRLGPAPLADCVGPGTGLDAAGVAHKLAVAGRAAARTDATAPLDVLAEFGGYEIAMMCGAILGAASKRRPVMIDGFIAGSAALVAIRLVPAVRDYCVFSHRSAERGHGQMLRSLEAEPYLDLGLRLGEGTGAVLAVPLVRAAAGILNGMADLADVLTASEAAS